MAEAVVGQIDEFNRVLQDTVGKISRTMERGLSILSSLHVPSEYVQPYVDDYNGQLREVSHKTEDIGKGTDQVRVTCARLMTLRQLGEHCQTNVAENSAYPLAESLSKSALQGNTSLSWQSTGSDRFWTYIDGNKKTADSVAKLCQSIGDEIIKLADALDKQNTDLGWAIAGTIGSILGGIGAAIGLGVAIGAITGLPAGGVGAIPGALIGGLIGAIVGLVGALIALAASIKAWVDAAHVLSNQAAESLGTLKSSARDAGLNPWPAPQGAGAGGDWRK